MLLRLGGENPDGCVCVCACVCVCVPVCVGIFTGL